MGDLIEAVSIEEKMDEEIETLIEKMVSGRAGDQDVARYKELVHLRSSMMQSPIVSEVHKLRQLLSA